MKPIHIHVYFLLSFLIPVIVGVYLGKNIESVERILLSIFLFMYFLATGFTAFKKECDK